jgi:hypothetical protein
VKKHALVIPPEGPRQARCACGLDLTVLMPHHPSFADAQKALQAHLLALEAE